MKQVIQYRRGYAIAQTAPLEILSKIYVNKAKAEEDLKNNTFKARHRVPTEVRAFVEFKSDTDKLHVDIYLKANEGNTKLKELLEQHAVVVEVTYDIPTQRIENYFIHNGELEPVDYVLSYSEISKLRDRILQYLNAKETKGAL